jgi:putative transposase
VQRILEPREENPGCGREKLHRLLLAEGVSISPKSIDRVIRRLKARGVLKEPLQMRKAPKPHLKRLRRPHDLSVEEPSPLVQMDSKYVQQALHQALGYLTPDQFYQHWLSNQPQRREAVSDMS